MDLVVVDARAKETARAGCLAEAHRAIIEKSTQRAATRAAGDPRDGRVFIRCLGRCGGRAQVVEGHDGGSIPLSVSLGQQHPCQQRHHYRGHEGHPVPHGSSSLGSTTLGTLDSPRRRGISENCMRRAKEETAGRTTPCSSLDASRFRKCKLFRLETWKGRADSRRKGVTSGSGRSSSLPGALCALIAELLEVGKLHLTPQLKL